MRRIFTFSIIIIACLSLTLRMRAQVCCPVPEKVGQKDQFLYEYDNIVMDWYTDNDGDWLKWNGENAAPTKWSYNKFIRIRAWSSRASNEDNYIQLYFWVGNSYSGKTQNYANGSGPVAGEYTVDVPAIGMYRYCSKTNGWGDCTQMTYLYFFTLLDLPASNKPTLIGYRQNDFYNEYEGDGKIWVSPFASYASGNGGPTTYTTSYSGVLNNISTFNTFTVMVDTGDDGNIYIQIGGQDCNTLPSVTIGRKTYGNVHQLSTSVTGNGSVAVNPNCEYHTAGDNIILTPVPANSTTCFKNWTGADASLIHDNHDGTYSLTMLNRDMAVTANFTDCNVIEANVEESVCSCDLPYIWNGITCNKANTYEYLCKAADGISDSITRLTLSVQTPVIQPMEKGSICDGTSYNWEGHSGFENIKEAKIYYDTIFSDTPNSQGQYCPLVCYSINIVKNSKVTKTVKQTMCYSEVVDFWNRII